MSADAVPGNGELPAFDRQSGSGARPVPTDATMSGGPTTAADPPSAAGRVLSARDKYLLVLSVVAVVATYVIGGYPLGYLRFPLAVYWIVVGVRYLQETGRP